MFFYPFCMSTIFLFHFIINIDYRTTNHIYYDIYMIRHYLLITFILLDF